MTCEWWGDLWIQEGAARYFESIGAQHAKPDWAMEQAYVSDVMYNVLSSDGIGSSMPVYVRRPDGEIESLGRIDSMFSIITYGKVRATLYQRTLEPCCVPSYVRAALFIKSTIFNGSLKSFFVFIQGSTIFRMIDRLIFREHRQGFNDAMRDYVARHAYSTATHDDLFAAFDRVSLTNMSLLHE